MVRFISFLFYDQRFPSSMAPWLGQGNVQLATLALEGLSANIPFIFHSFPLHPWDPSFYKLRLIPWKTHPKNMTFPKNIRSKLILSCNQFPGGGNGQNQHLLGWFLWVGEAQGVAMAMILKRDDCRGVAKETLWEHRESFADSGVYINQEKQNLIWGSI